MKQVRKNGDFLILGKYYLYNNLWGEDTGLGTQCIGGTSLNGSSIAWETRWNWKGQSNAIKSYSAAVLGWHWGWKVSNTGLPVRLSLIKNIHTAWEFKLIQNNPGKVNVTYDIWLSDNPRYVNEDPTGEIMIWLYKTGNIIPIGVLHSGKIIAGTGWYLWKGNHPISGWPVYSFVRKENTNSQSFDLMNFFRDLFSHGLRNSDYLLSIEAGIEVLTGSGKLDTALYSVDIG